MLNKNTLFTITTRFAILLCNFALVVLSTRLFGSEGRGVISLIIANISIIIIFNNTVSGSTVIYHSSKIPNGQLLLFALAGIVGFSVLGSIFFGFLHGFEWMNHLLVISIFMALNSFLAFYWLGKEKIIHYNLITLSGPALTILLLMIGYFLFSPLNTEYYFYAYYIAYFLVFVFGFAVFLKQNRINQMIWDRSHFKKLIFYGFENEFNYLIQFLNYRLSYYFISAILGLSSLGLFSVSIAVMEAIWVISKSLSVLHFSKVVNTRNTKDNISATRYQARISLFLSTLLVIILLIVPSSFFGYVFGAEFTEAKKYAVLLSPGILFIAFSNLYGHYFTGIGKLKILRQKSFIGLIATIILLPLLVPDFGIIGACISINVSYIFSSLYLYFKFEREASYTVKK
ncbi:MAG: polysaccharide biosynthesis C-terminal domain-containing protein [Bacteroidales bacterium]